MSNGVKIHCRKFESNRINVEYLRVNLVGAYFPLSKLTGAGHLSVSALSAIYCRSIYFKFASFVFEFTLLYMFIILLYDLRIYGVNKKCNRISI